MAKLVFHRNEFLAEQVRDKTVLDVGCLDHFTKQWHTAHWLHGALSKSARSIVGLDCQQAEVEELRREGYDVVCADATRFDLGRTFDFIVAGDIIEHLTCPAAFLACCRRHLAPGGRLILTTPNANCILYFVENVLLGHELDNTDHVCIYTPTTLRRFLNKCDYDLETVHFELRRLSHYQHSTATRAIADAMWLFQMCAGLLRPSLCRHLIAICRPMPASAAVAGKPGAA